MEKESINIASAVIDVPYFNKDQESSGPIDECGFENSENNTAINNLRELKNFFKLNHNIKESMAKMMPPYIDNPDYGDNSLYLDKLNTGVREISRQFDQLAIYLNRLGFGTDNVISKKNMMIEGFRRDVVNPSLDFAQLSAIYNKDIASMDPDFVKLVSKELISYTIFNDFDKALGEVKTFNELLHLVHMQLQSNEDFYEKLPKWGEDYDNGNQFDAYGEETKYARDLFNEAVTILGADRYGRDGNKYPPGQIMQMYSVDDIIQLLVRDFGHALTVEVDTSNPRAALVKYNIPKVTNIEMVNDLPGVNNIQDSSGLFGVANGKFEVAYDNIGKDIADFIMKIPTDKNII